MKTIGELLSQRFGAERVAIDRPLKPFTTFRVGGAADWFMEPGSADELLDALKLAHAAGIPTTILGGGSNVLIADDGIRGLILRPRGGEVRRIDPGHATADAAVTINGLVRWCILHGAAGIESWAGTPGTVGGAIHGNAHFGGALIGEHVTAVRVADRTGVAIELPVSAMEFGYDRSRLQRTGEVLLSATFRVAPGDPTALRQTARASLAFRKRTQPLDSPSAGCIFQNPQPARDPLPPGLPWSAGGLVDRAGLKGARCGGARVSPTHGNFIVNDGQATARDILTLVTRCRDAVRERFGIELRDEIVRLGDFDR